MPGLTRAGYVPPRGEPPRAGKPPKPSKGKRKKKKKRGMGGVAVFSLMVLLVAVLVGAATLYLQRDAAVCAGVLSGYAGDGHVACGEDIRAGRGIA